MKIAFAIAALVASGAATAREPVILENISKSGTTISGTCGPASVRVSGIDEYGKIPFVGSKIEITTNGKTEIYTADNGKAIFQDMNFLACGASKTGRAIVLQAFCSGSSCNPFDYTIIDATTGRTLTPLDSYDGCVEECAEQALGGPLPASMQRP